MKLNLISLGVLESKGFKVTLVNGGLKVTRGALILLRGVRENNLYFLLGHSIGGGVATIGKKPLFGSKLLHMKHGQVVLGTRQGLFGGGLMESVKTHKVRLESKSFGGRILIWMTRLFSMGLLM